MIDKKNNIWTIVEDLAISKWVRERGTLNWIPGEHIIVETLLRQRGPLRTVFDIGAFIGDYTDTYAQLFDRVYAFEPQDEAFECLLHNTSKYDNVYCFHGAVGSPDKSYSVALNPKNYGASNMIDDVSGRRYIPVPYLKDVDFIKIDVEGQEVQVLEACERVIKECHPALQIEQREADGTKQLVLDFLKKHGYTWKTVSGQEPIQYELFCT